MEKIDILWLIEHVAREMDVACTVKCLIKAKYGLNVKIRNYFLHNNFNKFKTKVVVHPFFYYALNEHGRPGNTGRYIDSFPRAVHFNMAWEQIFYQGIAKTKQPRDLVAKKIVIHHAWGNFYKKLLLLNGVTEDHIFLNGNPVYQLYFKPYNNYFQSRSQLAKKYKLNDLTTWIFVPENYRWAFITDQDIKWRTSIGGNIQEMQAMKKFCRESLAALLKWCHQLSQEKNITIIFRPKPVTQLKQMTDYYNSVVKEQKSDRLNFIQGESVREWILAADKIVSSFSTTLIEAAIAEKPIFMAEPQETIEPLKNKWYNYLPRIRNLNEFLEMGTTTHKSDSQLQFRKWAMNEMLAQGDPIENLAAYISKLVNDKKVENIDLYKYGLRNDKESVQSSGLFNYLINFFSRGMKYLLNLPQRWLTRVDGHSNDSFSEKDVRLRVKKWKHTLLVNSD